MHKWVQEEEEERRQKGKRVNRIRKSGREKKMRLKEKVGKYF